ncbi:MAG: radical SAM protein [Kiritimatiellia bacterium]|nr:radical SAM protein [Kiritimatiellia bacterium]
MKLTNTLLCVPLPAFLETPPFMPDLGLGYIAAAMRRDDLGVKLQDWNCKYTPDEFGEFLDREQFGVVGMKVFTVNFKGALRSLALVRESLPDTVLIIGGPHPSTADQKFIFDEFPMIDLAFRGEAETAFPRIIRLLETIDGKRDRISEVRAELAKIPGVVWRDSDGSAKWSDPILEDVDSLDFPAWDLIPPENYPFPVPREITGDRHTAVAPIVTSRGCPFSCTFCCAHLINGRHTRYRRAESIVDEMELLSREYGASYFTFVDSSFMLNRKHLRSVCEELSRRKLPILWECIYEVQQDDPDQDDLDETLQLMYGAGCRKMIVSVETASPRIVKRVGKDFSVENIRAVHKKIREHGIITHGFFMFGFPGETVRDLKATAAFALREPFNDVSFSVCIPLPGTEIYRELQEKHGFDRIDWNSYNVTCPPYRVAEISPGLFFRLATMANGTAVLKNRNMPLRRRGLMAARHFFSALTGRG